VTTATWSSSDSDLGTDCNLTARLRPGEVYGWRHYQQLPQSNATSIYVIKAVGHLMGSHDTAETYYWTRRVKQR
jgi:hypothetical protein